MPPGEALRTSLIVLVPVGALLLAAVVSHYRDLAWRVRQAEVELADLADALDGRTPTAAASRPPRLAAVHNPPRRVDITLAAVDGEVARRVPGAAAEIARSDERLRRAPW